MKSLLLQTKKGTGSRQALEFVHDMYHELGIQDLTVQTEDAWVAAASYFSSFTPLLMVVVSLGYPHYQFFERVLIRFMIYTNISNMFLSVDDSW